MSGHRCCYCGRSSDAHFRVQINGITEAHGDRERHGHYQHSLADCPGYIATNAHLDAELEAARRRKGKT